MKTEYTKHYYDPFERLDQNWREVVATGFLTVNQVAKLSGYSRQHIYNVISQGNLITVKKDNKTVVSCKAFVKWVSSLNISNDSPLGYSSYSLRGLMDLTDMGRIWVLKFAERNSIPSYYCGVYRRFHKQESEKAWKLEWFKYAKWITSEDAKLYLDVNEIELYTMVAKHFVEIKQCNGRRLFSKRDILKEIKWREDHE